MWVMSEFADADVAMLVNANQRLTVVLFLLQ